jgi:hypothetical protein
LYARALAYQSEQVRDVYQGCIAEFGKTIEEYNGFVRTGWCFARECEDQLVAYKGSIRCILDEMVPDNAQCFACKKPATHVVIAAKSY